MIGRARGVPGKSTFSTSDLLVNGAQRIIIIIIKLMVGGHHSVLAVPCVILFDIHSNPMK